MQRFFQWLKKYFVPHPGNDHKPHFLRHESVLVVFFVIIILELGFLVQVFLVFDKTKFLAAVLPGVLASITNEERAENNAPPLVQSDLLNKAAQLKAEDMATHGYFAHTSPEGKTPWYWFGQVGYSYSSAGENLAVNFFESVDVAKAWMNSPSHRANIIKKDFTEIGIGVASGVYEGRNTVFVAQLFGTPLKVFQIPKAEASPTPVVLPKEIPKTTTPSKPIEPVAIKILGEDTSVTQPSVTKSIEVNVEKILTSPRQSVTYVYGGIALLIVLALLLAFFIKFEIQHPLILIRGLFLFAVVIVLLFVNVRVLHLETRVPASDGNNLNANVIEVFLE